MLMYISCNKTNISKRKIINKISIFYEIVTMTTNYNTLWLEQITTKVVKHKTRALYSLYTALYKTIDIIMMTWNTQVRASHAVVTLYYNYVMYKLLVSIR